MKFVKTITPNEALTILKEEGMLKGNYAVKGEIHIPEDFPFDRIEICCSNGGIFVKGNLKYLLIAGETGSMAVCDNASIDSLTIVARVERLAVCKTKNGIPGKIKTLHVGMASNGTSVGELAELQVFMEGKIEEAQIESCATSTRAYVNDYLLAQQLHLQGVRVFIPQKEIFAGIIDNKKTE